MEEIWSYSRHVAKGGRFWPSARLKRESRGRSVAAQHAAAFRIY